MDPTDGYLRISYYRLNEFLHRIKGGESRLLRQLGCVYQKQENEKRINGEQEKETIGDKVSSLFRSRSTRQVPCSAPLPAAFHA